MLQRLILVQGIEILIVPKVFLPVKLDFDTPVKCALRDWLNWNKSKSVTKSLLTEDVNVGKLCYSTIKSVAFVVLNSAI